MNCLEEPTTHCLELLSTVWLVLTLAFYFKLAMAHQKQIIYKFKNFGV
jgi:hypothetical protein